ncbi:MAG TPA: sigma-70 family RNA polymerase sigma factor [Tepidisphaeraceae bacterium]
MTPDHQLLEQFVAENSQAAFRQLVERHSHWLYSVCQRRLGDSALAEDATQAVFLALAKRAPQLLREKTISPWLHQAAKFCASNLLRAQSRRRRHEREAAIMKANQSSGDSQWRQIEMDLEPALDRLAARDRAPFCCGFMSRKVMRKLPRRWGFRRRRRRSD